MAEKQLARCTRLASLAAHLAAHRQLYGGAASLLLLHGDRNSSAPSYTVPLQRLLLGCEFPRSALLFAGGTCYVHALGQVKVGTQASKLEQLFSYPLSGAPVVLVPRAHGVGTNAAAYAVLLAAITAAGPGGVGVVLADKASVRGEMADEVRAALAGVMEVDAMRGVELFLAARCGFSLGHVAQAGALAAHVARDHFVRLLEAALDGGSRTASLSNADLAAQVTGELLEEPGTPVPACWAAGPLVQSGGGLSTHVTSPELESSAARLSAGVILYSAVMKHETHQALVARTYLVDASPAQLGVYESLLDAHDFLLDQLRPGAVIRHVVAAVTARFAARAGVPPGAKLSHTFGSALGSRFCGVHEYCALSSANDAVISEGMVFGVVTGLTDVPLVDAHPSTATTMGRLSSYALLLADTAIVVADGPPRVVTETAPKQRTHVVYSLATATGVAQEEEEEEKEEAADDAEAGDSGGDSYLAVAPAPVSHHPDVLRQIMLIVAAHGHTREAALVTRAVADLHHDPELLARTQLEPAVVGGASQFAVAVKCDDTARATELLGACPTAASRKALVSTGSPLDLCKSPAMATLLLQAGASLGVEENFSGPIYYAAHGERSDVLAVLLGAFSSDEARRALVTRVGPQSGNMTLPYVAMQHAHSNVLAVLLDALGSDEARRALATYVNPHNGTTILMHAMHGHPAHVLLEAGGADLSAVDHNGLDACDHGAAFGKYGILQELFGALPSDEARRERVVRADAQGRTLLMRVHNGEDARLLLNEGADLAAVDLQGRDAFSHAATAPNGYLYVPAVLQVLLAALPSHAARQARVNTADAQGRTLLMMSQDGAVMDSLLRAGADPGAVDKDGHDAFWHALRHRNFESDSPSIVTVLLAALHPKEARRARVNLQVDDAWMMPLMLSRSCGDAQAMLAAGAQLRAVTQSGRDALDWAMMGNNVDVARLLLRELGSGLGRRTRVNRPDVHGNTPLMRFRNVKMATLLLEAGADVHAVNEDGEDAVDCAIDEGEAAVLKVLLASLGSAARRVRVNRRDATGSTPLMRACPSDVVRALLDAGADVRAVDNAGHDVFYRAAERAADIGDESALEELRDSLCYEERIAVTRRADLKALGVTWGEEEEAPNAEGDADA